MGMEVLDNTPYTGYISWTDVGISYKGKTYNIDNGNTNLAYIYWRYADPYSFYGGNVFPTLGADDLLVFVNKSGTHLVVPNTTILDGSLFVPGSIIANALAVNSVTSEKIIAGAISATQIAVGAVGADKIAANAVIADKIAAGAVDAGKISVGSLSAISANLGSITAGDITGVNISGSTLKISNAPMYSNGTTFVQMKNGEIFITDVNPDTITRANANDVHIDSGAVYMVGHNATGITQYELDLAPKFILFTELNTDNTIKYQTNIRAEFLESPKVTTSDLTVNGLTALSGNVAIAGQLTVPGIGSNVDMNYHDLSNIKNLYTANASGLPVMLLEGGSLGISDTTGAYVNLYIRPAAGGEVRIVTPTSNTTYQHIRASFVYANAVDINTGSHVYIRPIASTGEVKVTATGSTTDFRPIRARSFITDTSNRENKKDIEIYREKTLDVFRNAQVYTYLRLNDDENAFRQLGMMIDETPRLLHGETGDSFDLYALTSFMGKGIKDIITVLDTHSDENQILKQKVAQLEEEVNYLKQQIA